jgi:hypothetical protein
MNSRRLRIGAATAISVVAASLAATTPPAAHAAECGFTSTPAPTLSGNVREGDMLTAHHGTWSPSPDSYTFGWFIIKQDGSVEQVPGSGEGTYYRGSTYVPDSDEVGTQIKVRVTATRGGCATFADSEPTVPVHPREYNEGFYPDPPTPSFSGTLTVGRTLTADAGPWPAGTSLEYRWYVVDGDAYVPMTGLSASRTLRLPGDSLGLTIAVKVQGTVGYHRPTLSGPSDSSATTVARGTLTTSRPTITGTRKVGRKLTLVRHTWTSGTRFSFRWYANGRAIPRATARTLTLKSAQKGKRITVKVTGSQTGYKTASRTSAATARIAR